jgi:hypothetical protein
MLIMTRVFVMKCVAINILLAVYMVTGTTEGEEPNLIPREFTLTPEEESQTVKWKNLSMDDLVKDAFQGDSAGLYMIGMNFLVGSPGVTIDVHKANNFFSMSASLGFAPSLRQIGNMYLEEKNNMFLALVYFNLAASYGHPELALAYHKARALLIETTNVRVAEEIEKIAAKKQERIETNSRDARLPENRLGGINKVLICGNIVMLDDIIYGNDYWAGVLRRIETQEQVATETNQIE